ncbi:hypothetical protein X975_12234, partial [Stegodyphus mimosarum]
MSMIGMVCTEGNPEIKYIAFEITSYKCTCYTSNLRTHYRLSQLLLSISCRGRSIVRLKRTE